MVLKSPSAISFAKMSGAGNDFIVIDNRDGMLSDPGTLARVLCDRRRGIGGDGLLLVERSSKADFSMKYYNADGSYGGMCGNGGRCISRFAYMHGVVSSPEIRFEALDHIYRATVTSDMVQLEMKPPRDFQLKKMLDVGERRILFHSVDTGSPHCVIFLDENPDICTSIDALDLVTLGREIRYHKHFSPQGTNVNFVDQAAPKSIRVRTYERGVEAETLACGTGSVASVLIAHQIKGMESPIDVLTSSSERLEIAFNLTGPSTYDHVTLFGSAHITFTGTVSLNITNHSLAEPA